MAINNKPAAHNDTEELDPEIESRLEPFREQLRDFLQDNPWSRVAMGAGEHPDQPFIRKPWGEDALALNLGGEDKKLFAVLNSLILPERLSAVYHKASRSLEVIWTAFELPADQRELSERKFVFEFDGSEHECEFTDSSPQLLVLARATEFLGISYSQHRNLTSYAIWSDAKEGTTGLFDLDKPRSFWVRNVDWNEENIVSLVRRLNFYLTYYDARSPTVLIHSPEADDGVNGKLRYLHGSYPTRINSSQIADTVLHFWSAAGAGDNARRFLYHYRIIEFAAFFYLEQSSRSAIRKALSSPHASMDVDRITEKVMAAISETKMDDVSKFNAVLRDNVDPSLLWREVANNHASFCRETKFDGGFTLQPLIGVNMKEEDFAARGLDAAAKSFREIRNALSHGRDQKTSHVIVPSADNLRRLRPWLNLIAVAAGEVALFGQIS